VAVLREGAWSSGSARLIGAEDPARPVVVADYLGCWPRTAVPADQPVVLVELGGSGH